MSEQDQPILLEPTPTERWHTAGGQVLGYVMQLGPDHIPPISEEARKAITDGLETAGKWQFINYHVNSRYFADNGIQIPVNWTVILEDLLGAIQANFSQISE